VALKITVKAPSSTANLGPGFGVFGLAVNAFYDEVTLTKTKTKGLRIVTEDDIPTNPDKNTAGLVVKNMIDTFKTKDGIEIKIKKNVPAGFGMGSSAASAAAAAFAFWFPDAKRHDRTAGDAARPGKNHECLRRCHPASTHPIPGRARARDSNRSVLSPLRQ